MQFASIPWFEALRLIVDANVKATLICLLAMLFILILKKTSASLRNQIWVTALIALLVLPLLFFIVPMQGLSILPDPELWGLRAPAPLDAADAKALLAAEDFSEQRLLGSGLKVSKPFWVEMRWPHYLLVVWALGVLLSGLWAIISHAGLGRIRRRSLPADQSWQALLSQLCARLSLKRGVTLLRSPSIRTGITMGILRPAVIFPVDADEWPESRRRLVLSHELAHIKRWDSLIELLAALVFVFYWFNPLVCYAIRQQRIERERDCDNAVLNIGAKPSDYAMQLMEIAAKFGQAPLPIWRTSRISQGSNLKDRLLYILDPSVERRGRSPRSSLLMLLLIALLVLPLSAFGLWGDRDGDPERLAETEMKKKQTQDSVELFSSWSKSSDSAAYVVAKTLKAQGLDRALKTYVEMREDASGRYFFKESEFNKLGYDLLSAEKIDEAIAIFKLNVKAFPESWNVYDSLAEAYVLQGDYHMARKYYEHSLTQGSKVETTVKQIVRRLEKALADDQGGWDAKRIMAKKDMPAGRS